MIFSLVVLSLKLSAGRVSPNWVNLRSCKHYFKNEWGSWFFKFEVMALKWYKPNMCLFFRFCLRPTHILKHSDSRRLAASCSHRPVAPGGHPQILTYQLTLSQPRGQVITTRNRPPIFRPSYSHEDKHLLKFLWPIVNREPKCEN